MPKQILIVDDNELNLSLMTRILEMEGYMVITAHNGQDALRQAQIHSPDMIILDVMMPDISGYDLCRALRMPPMNVDVPIIMLTAMDSDTEQILAKDAGANEVWSKPFDFDTFTVRVKELIKS
jgi:DNA-binding response OmpR family regulator